MLSQKGFGTLEKYIMIWNNEDDLVWPHDVPWFELITPAFSNNSKWTTFSNPTQFKEMPVLCGWVGAQDARDIEAQTDDEILDDVAYTRTRDIYTLYELQGCGIWQVFIVH